jgi:hypothetical protein
MFEQDKGFTRGRSKSHNGGGDIRGKRGKRKRGKSKGREEGGSFPPMAMGFFGVSGEGKINRRE